MFLARWRQSDLIGIAAGRAASVRNGLAGKTRGTMSEDTDAAPAMRGAGSAARLIVAAAVGNALEFYEILVYGYFAVTIAKVFFPAADPAVSILVTFGTFGIAFLARPVGAIFLGAYGDRRGRKRALTLSILLMTLGTGLMTIMPSYGAIGLAAPILVVAARLLQGFSVGGEFASATTFLVEHRPDRAGFFASWQWASQGLAALIATGLGVLLTTTLSAGELQSWGWRIPFGFGLLIGPVGYYIRNRMAETPEFLAAGAARSPLRELFAAQWDRLLLTVGAVVASTSSQYLIVYLVTYAIRELHLPQSMSLTAGLLAAALQMFTVPFVGLLADRVGQIPIMLGAADPVRAHVLSGLCRARNLRLAWRADPAGVLAVALEVVLFRRAAVADGEDLSGGDARFRPVARIQYRGADLRRLCAVLRAVADRSHRLEARAGLLHDGDRGAEPCGAHRDSAAV